MTPRAPDGLSLVLGAGGFLGSHIGAWLARAGGRARLFDLSVETIPPAVRAAPGIEVVQGNMLDEEDLARALRGVDRVFHLICATVPSTSVDRPDVEIQANVIPTVRLLESMRRAGAPLVIFPSSGGTLYGDAGTAGVFTEEAPVRPSCSYGLGKVMIEQLLDFRAHEGGPHFIALRFSNPYGPSVHDHRRQGVVNAFLQGVQRDEPLQVWGDGSAVRDFLYIDDLIAAVAAVCDAGVRDEALNVGSGVGHSILEVIALIRAVTGRNPRIEHVPGAYHGVARNVLGIARIHARTGWTPVVDLRAGIARTWAAMTTANP